VQGKKKQPARASPAGCERMHSQFLFTRSFSLGCLECIDDFVLFDFAFYVTGEVAGAVFPLKFGLRICPAVFAGREIRNFFAAVTLGDNLHTGASVVAASGFAHEEALYALFGCLTNHGV
jgi:hypothetical protein